MSKVPLYPSYPPQREMVEQLRENLADFNEKHFQKSRILFQDVTCNRSI